jgi:hypothetical protein
VRSPKIRYDRAAISLVSLVTNARLLVNSFDTNYSLMELSFQPPQYWMMSILIAALVPLGDKDGKVTTHY